MAFTPITGAISFADINTALGRASTTSFSLNDTLVRQLTNQLSGTVTMNNAHASDYISATTTNVNLLTRFGSPATVTAYKSLIPSGVTVGATAGNTAYTVGQFATGSTIVINNYGAIQAYGGAASSAGGDAINANYANQTVTINNQTGGTIYGGGGGGGTGGSGGTGGTGGGGYYTDFSGYNYQYDGCAYQARYFYAYTDGCCNYHPAKSVFCWANVQVYNADGDTGTVYVGGYYYTRGTLEYADGTRLVWDIGQGYYYNVYTSGGAGGGGGAGGAGGVGQGYGQAAAGGAGGSPGAGGAGGGTNAGAGGSGGYGGTGGTGGTYGTAGATGASGATGNTGASGNNGGGAGGSAGAGGAGGGSAGRYLVKGANSVTLNNSGTVLGGLA